MQAASVALEERLQVPSPEMVLSHMLSEITKIRIQAR
jgi:hypothetical protein